MLIDPQDIADKCTRGNPGNLCCPPASLLQKLVDAGALGQKSGGGIYRKSGRDIHVLDPASGVHRTAGAKIAPEVDEVLNVKSPAERLGALRAQRHPQAQFLWATFRDVFHYCAAHLAEIADNARDVDLAQDGGILLLVAHSSLVCFKLLVILLGGDQVGF